MMWELIRQNRRKSLILFAGMALLLSVLGYAVGAVFNPEQGGIIGLILAIGLWITLTLISVSSGDDIILKISQAREVTPDVHPRLFNVVEEMKIAAGLPAMPKVYIVDDPSPNAFAIGIKPEKSAVAVTAGLLEQLNRDELQGVVAHEVSHIANRDSQLMTVAGIMLGSIVLISHFFLRSMWFMPSSSRRYRKDSGGGDPRLQLIMVVVAIALAILAPIFARLLYLAVSRKREYLADATAAQFTRYPEGLASALEKISSSALPLESANKVTAPMYIVNPLLKKDMKLSSLGSTHPPTEQRIKILRGMAGRADYLSYQRAFSKVTKKHSAVIPASGLRNTKRVQARTASPGDVESKSNKKTARDVMDLMRAVNGYAFLVCACGLKIKLPPELAKPAIDCPKCGRENKIPGAELATVGAVVGAVAGTDGEAILDADPDASQSGERYEYHRKGTGWETFACACGNRLQLSPAFKGTVVGCRLCGRNTTIK
ncbi:MAG: M48 family metallopeptidase [Candidatus Latescibacterota bacterium]|nr:MAG: M48 family metallopeptidase [Candidatus Latescibacterota bacterium]